MEFFPTAARNEVKRDDMNEPLLKIHGAVEEPLTLTFADLAAFPASAQFADVSRIHPGRRGDGVVLDAILDQAQVRPGANYVTLHADKDDFHVSVPLEALKGQGIVVYKQGAQPLGTEHGGPIRLIIRDPAACHTGELDDCANVKYLSRIELTERRGRDTRPETEAEHAALHAAPTPPPVNPPQTATAQSSARAR
jgi:DMSO/TMAO reductase YedYZ molybdopterin-dependent catalytic subunit